MDVCVSHVCIVSVYVCACMHVYLWGLCMYVCIACLYACTCVCGGEGPTTKPLDVRDATRWLSGKESTCQYRRRGFDPWVGKIPRRRERQPTPVLSPGKSHG